jgi:hypothetical protein
MGDYAVIIGRAKDMKVGLGDFYPGSYFIIV